MQALVTADLERTVDNSLHNGELLAIAAPALNQQRLPPKEMENILELCKDRWLTRNESATLVHRNPEKPNRTDQGYTTVIDDA